MSQAIATSAAPAAHTQRMIGKIDRARFGFCGYQDQAFGLYVHLSGPAWGVSADVAAYPANPPQTKADVMERVSAICIAAGAKGVDDLRGKPIEVEFENGVLKSWRILTEAI
jgi:hypothetical protein